MTKPIAVPVVLPSKTPEKISMRSDFWRCVTWRELLALRLEPSTPLASRLLDHQIALHALQTEHHPRKPVVVELVRSVAQRVLVCLAEWRGVGHNHRGPAEVPVRPLGGPTHPRDRLQ